MIVVSIRKRGVLVVFGHNLEPSDDDVMAPFFIFIS